MCGETAIDGDAVIVGLLAESNKPLVWQLIHLKK
jgi:hypothetical protein